MTLIKQTSHDKWEQLTNEEIDKYISKYVSLDAPGKCSARRKKKIKYLQSIINRRNKAIRLIAGKQ